MMGNRLIEFALKNRFLVLLGTALIAGAGLLAMRHLPIDAVPDITNVQVQVLTNAPALATGRSITFSRSAVSMIVLFIS